MGKPDLFCDDLRIAVYPVEELERRKLVLLFFFIPIRSFTDYPGYQIACIEFDERERVRRYGTTTGYLGLSSGDLRFYAKEWIQTRDVKKPEHLLSPDKRLGADAGRRSVTYRASAARRE